MRTKILCVLLCLVALAGSGCVRVLHKEFEVEDGKSRLRSETEYNRVGDQEMSGIKATKNTSVDGTQLSIEVEQQRSEGKVQIEGLIAALTELVAVLVERGMPEEAAQAESVIKGLESLKNP